MSATFSQSRDDANRTLVVLLAAALASGGLHVGVLVWAHFRDIKMPVVQKPIEMEMIELPKPPEPEVKKEEPPPPPEPPKVKIKVPPPVVKVAETVKPRVEEPPPPNQEPPPDAKPAPVVIGLSLDSTSAAGSFKVATGNSLYGKTDNKAVAPAEVKPYAAPKYVPPGSADTEPSVAAEVKIPYPEEAKRAGQEGQVRLRIRVEADGTVSEVSVLKGIGYGLDEAARDALKRFKFKPAIKGGEPVATTMIYVYSFFLD